MNSARFIWRFVIFALKAFYSLWALLSYCCLIFFFQSFDNPRIRASSQVLIGNVKMVWNVRSLSFNCITDLNMNITAGSFKSVISTQTKPKANEIIIFFLIYCTSIAASCPHSFSFRLNVHVKPEKLFPSPRELLKCFAAESCLKAVELLMNFSERCAESDKINYRWRNLFVDEIWWWLWWWGWKRISQPLKSDGKVSWGNKRFTRDVEKVKIRWLKGQKGFHSPY